MITASQEQEEKAAEDEQISRMVKVRRRGQQGKKEKKQPVSICLLVRVMQ